MILGLSIAAFTKLHTLISLVGIVTGLVFLIALLRGRWLGGWNLWFLVFTILTSVTGFPFLLVQPKIGPPHIVGAISLVDLAIALLALYQFKRAGIWRPIYTITAVFALYLNCFVLVVQSFQKIPFLHADGIGAALRHRPGAGADRLHRRRHRRGSAASRPGLRPA